MEKRWGVKGGGACPNVRGEGGGVVPSIRASPLNREFLLQSVSSGTVKVRNVERVGPRGLPSDVLAFHPVLPKPNIRGTRHMSPGGTVTHLKAPLDKNSLPGSENSGESVKNYLRSIWGDKGEEGGNPKK